MPTETNHRSGLRPFELVANAVFNFSAPFSDQKAVGKCSFLVRVWGSGATRRWVFHPKEGGCAATAMPADDRAVQPPLPHWTFDALSRERDRIHSEEMGRGLTCDIADYLSGGRLAAIGRGEIR